MNPLEAVRNGARAVNRVGRMWFLFWIFNALFAAAVAAPAVALLSARLGNSLYGERMFANFELQWVAEHLLDSGGAGFAVLGPAAAALGAGYVLLSVFLSGGALSVFARPGERYSAALFWQGCGKHFGRFLRLLVLAGVGYAAVLILYAILTKLGGRIWENSMEGRPVVMFSMFRATLTFLLLAHVNMAYDYGRISLVAEDSRSALRAALVSLTLAARNFGRTAGTYAVVLVLVMLLIAAYQGLSSLLPRRNIALVLAMLVVQQAFVAGRMWTRLLFFAAQSEMYLAIRPVPVPEAEPPGDEPAAGVESQSSGQQAADGAEVVLPGADDRLPEQL